MQLSIVSKVVSIGKLITLFGESFKLVAVRAVVMMSRNEKMTVFIIELNKVQMTNTVKQFIYSSNKLTTFCRSIPPATSSCK